MKLIAEALILMLILTLAGYDCGSCGLCFCGHGGSGGRRNMRKKGGQYDFKK